MRLPLRGIITTNLDPGLVEAQHSLQRESPPDVATWKDVAIVNAWKNGHIFEFSQCPILHAHGIYNRPESFVLAVDEYRQAYNSTPFAALFDDLWCCSKLLFVGFGFSDPWIDFIAEAALSQRGSRRIEAPPHVALIGLPETDAFSPEMRRITSEQYHAECLFYPISMKGGKEDHSQLLDVLHSLQEPLRDAAASRSQPPSIERDPSTVDVDRLPHPRMHAIGREELRDELFQIWNTHDINVLSLIAGGGSGKSALVWAWLEEMKKNDYYGASRVLGWSFESGKFDDPAISSDDFISTALSHFCTPGCDRDSPWADGERLADDVGQQRNLLILDGLETLQSDRPAERGAIKDPALATLITELAKNNTGLCIITSRAPVTDIAAFPKHETRNLERLSPQAGGRILQEAKLLGAQPGQLERISNQFGGHALALTLLASWLRRSFSAGSRHVARVEELFNGQDEDYAGEDERHAYRVMGVWAKQLRDTPDLEFLYITAIFNKPVELQTMKWFTAQHCPPLYPMNIHLRHMDEAAWLRVVRRLDHDHLISFRVNEVRCDSNRGGTRSGEWVDTHPLVRTYFADKLKQHHYDTWRAAHSWLYERYCEVSPEQPVSVQELDPLYEAVAHGCKAGRHAEALVEVYVPRIRRGWDEAYSALILGAYGADLSVLSNFFERRSTTRAYHELVPQLSDKQHRAFVRGVASFSLRALGRLREACDTRYIALNNSLAIPGRFGADYDAPALAEILLVLGDIQAAIVIARYGVEIVDDGDNEERRVDNRATLADILHQADKLDEAETIFKEAEEFVQKRGRGEWGQLFLLPGYQYLELLQTKWTLAGGWNGFEAQQKWQELLKRAANAKRLARRTKKDRTVGTALADLSLGQIYLLGCSLKEKHSSYCSRARRYLESAVNGLRRARQQDLIPLGLIARAAMRREQGQFKDAMQDLNSAMAIATSGSAADLAIGVMKLHEADIHLGYARLAQSEALQMLQDVKMKEATLQKLNEASMQLKKAAKIIGDIGYNRRNNEIHRLETELASLATR